MRASSTLTCVLMLLPFGPLFAQPAEEKPAVPRPPTFLAQAQPEIVESYKVELLLAEWNEKSSGLRLSQVLHNKDGMQQVLHLEKEGKLQQAKRIAMTVVDGQPATLQVGGRIPRVVGSVSGFGGRATQNTVSFENMGTLVRITASARNEGIRAEVVFERTAPSRDTSGPVIGEQAEGEKIRAETIETTSISTTVLLNNGETVVVSATSEGEKCQVLLLTIKL